MHAVEGNVERDGQDLIIPGQLRFALDRSTGQFDADGRSEVACFRDWSGLDDKSYSWYNQRMVYIISQEFKKGKFLKLSASRWHPFACQGSNNTTSFHFFQVPSNCDDICWSRSPGMVLRQFWKDRNWKSMPLAIAKKQSLQAAFDAILQPGLTNRLDISKMEDEVAYEVLYSKLLHHPSLTKIELSFRHCCKTQTLTKFCCNLILNSKTLEEVFIQDFGSLNDDTIQTLFECTKMSRNLKSLDLRTSRYLETWSKAHSGGGRDSDKPIIRAEPILAGLKFLESSPDCPLESLDFGGNKLVSSTSMSELTATLLSPALGLERLSLRACDLTEEMLIAVATELENNHCLEFLDLSHNTITKPVMELLVKNNTLKELKLEHCKIDLEIVEVLANALPQMQRLQHLHMDGNEFTWEPLTEAKEAVGAITMLKALEKNKSLHSLSMGEFGKLASWGMSCCQPPPYHTTLGSDNLTLLARYQNRNKEFWEEMKGSRSQQAVVKIAEILLGKLSDDVE